MGEGFLIGCNKCVTKEDLDNFGRKDSNNKGNIFDILLDRGMLCFCKEQLEEIYGINKKSFSGNSEPHENIYKISSMTDDINIDKNIYENINNGFEFTEYFGYISYYCENCKKLFSRFHFEMKKDNKIYKPEYTCKKCSHILEYVYIAWEEYYENKKVININLNGEDKKLLCENCGNDQFTITSYYNWD